MHFIQNIFKFIYVALATLICTIAYAEANTITADVKSLDATWENRHNLSTQKNILKYIQSNPTISNEFETSWRIARLVYFIGNFGVGETLNAKEQIQVFEVGYHAAEIAKTLQPKRVEGHYWYAINIGKYSLAKGKFSALNHAKIGRDALLEAIAIDPGYHFGGAYRILGRYYQDLPSGISFGDKKKAEEYYYKAIEIAPEFRLNSFYLAKLIKNKTEKARLLKIASEKPNTDGETEENRYRTLIANEMKQLK